MDIRNAIGAVFRFEIVVLTGLGVEAEPNDRLVRKPQIWTARSANDPWEERKTNLNFAYSRLQAANDKLEVNGCHFTFAVTWSCGAEPLHSIAVGFQAREGSQSKGLDFIKVNVIANQVYSAMRGLPLDPYLLPPVTPPGCDEMPEGVSPFEEMEPEDEEVRILNFGL